LAYRSLETLSILLHSFFIEYYCHFRLSFSASLILTFHLLRHASTSRIFSPHNNIATLRIRYTVYTIICIYSFITPTNFQRQDTHHHAMLPVASTASSRHAEAYHVTVSFLVIHMPWQYIPVRHHSFAPIIRHMRTDHVHHAVT